MGTYCKHGHHRNYESTGTWRSWSAMVARYKWRKGYKERGICEDWIGEHGFENFLSDMGERPNGMTIERVDNDRGYYPDNCIWTIQYGLSSQTLRHRLYKQKMSMEDALTSPKNMVITQGGKFYG